MSPIEELTHELVGAAQALDLLYQTFRKPAADYVAEREVPGGKKASYIPHAHLRDILCASDPLWTWSPLNRDQNGFPCWKTSLVTAEGHPVGLWVALTVHGTTKPGYGEVAPGAQSAIKKLISLALVNASTSFGIGITLKMDDPE